MGKYKKALRGLVAVIDEKNSVNEICASGAYEHAVELLKSPAPATKSVDYDQYAQYQMLRGIDDMAGACLWRGIVRKDMFIYPPSTPGPWTMYYRIIGPGESVGTWVKCGTNSVRCAYQDGAKL
jgi:hypothetical protein